MTGVKGKTRLLRLLQKSRLEDQISTPGKPTSLYTIKRQKKSPKRYRDKDYLFS